jgi:hypothetical protein
VFAYESGLVTAAATEPRPISRCER